MWSKCAWMTFLTSLYVDNYADIMHMNKMAAIFQNGRHFILFLLNDIKRREFGGNARICNHWIHYRKHLINIQRYWFNMADLFSKWPPFQLILINYSQRPQRRCFVDNSKGFSFCSQWIHLINLYVDNKYYYAYVLHTNKMAAIFQNGSHVIWFWLN